MLLLNSVYKYYEFERKERVLWFNIELNLISVIDINNNTAWPEILKFSDYYDRLISDEIIQVDDPFTLLPDNLSAKDIHIRDRAWDIISKIVSSLFHSSNITTKKTDFLLNPFISSINMINSRNFCGALPS